MRWPGALFTDDILRRGQVFSAQLPEYKNGRRRGWNSLRGTVVLALMQACRRGVAPSLRSPYASRSAQASPAGVTDPGSPFLWLLLAKRKKVRPRHSAEYSAAPRQNRQQATEPEAACPRPFPYTRKCRTASLKPCARRCSSLAALALCWIALAFCSLIWAMTSTRRAISLLAAFCSPSASPI